MEGKAADLRFEALRNAIYHTARRMFLDRCSRLLNLIVIVAGASAVGQLGNAFGITDSAPNSLSKIGSRYALPGA